MNFLDGSLFPEFLSQFNGMWLYDRKDNLVSCGFVTMLDSKNPFNDPHLEAQKFKNTPFMRDLLDGAELVRDVEDRDAESLAETFEQNAERLL